MPLIDKWITQHLLRTMSFLAFVTLSLFPQTAVLADRTSVIILGNEPTSDIGAYLEVLNDELDEFTPFQIALPEWATLWQPQANRVLNLGYVNTPHWVKFRIDTSASIYKEWDLVLKTASLDLIDIYQVYEDTGPRLIYRSGMQRAFDNRTQDHRFFIVPIDAYNAAGEYVEFMIRIQTSGNLYVPMELHPSKAFWSSLQILDVYNWLFYGIIVAMVLYNLFLFSSVKDTAYLYYVLFIASFALLHLSIDGYIFQHFWPSDQPYSYAFDSAFSLTSSMFGLLFISRFLNLKQHLPRVNQVMLALVAMHVPVIAAVFYYSDQAMDRFLMLPLAFMLIIAVSIGFYGWKKRLATARYFLLAWVLFALGNIYLILSLSGYLHANFSPYYASKAAAFAEAMLLSFALADRIRRLRDEREKQRLKAEAQSYFLAQISHEIRTPLNGVLGTVELLDKTNLSEEQQEYIDVIKSSGRSLLTLVSDVLDYSKIEAGKMVIQEEQVAIRDLAQQQVELFRSMASQKGLELTLQIANQVPQWVLTDSHRLRQVWSNLLSNAIKFTDQGYVRAKLSISEQSGRSYVRFDVSDSGIGIDAADIPDLFNAYQQVELGKRRVFGGTGLGLAISKDLVELLGGAISVVSSKNSGSTFTTLTPLQAISQPVVDGNIESENTGVTAITRSLKILVAEDNTVNQKVIVGLLQKLNHQVTVVPQGDEVVSIRLLADFDYDAILMDCEMPVMDGYEATRLIRDYEKQQKLPRVPIIALTAHALEEIKGQCMEAGMNDFLTKPINTNLLVRVLNRYS